MEIERIMRSKSSGTIRPNKLKEGSKVLDFYLSSRQNEPNEGVPATVISMDTHIVHFRRREKGPPMTFSHNVIRIMPTEALKDELLEKETGDDDEDDRNSRLAPRELEITPEEGVKHATEERVL